MRLYGLFYLYMQGCPVEIQTTTSLEPERPQYDRPSSCVIAQQYYFIFFIIPFLYSQQGKKLDESLKNITISTSFSNCVREGVSVLFILNTLTAL